MTFGILATLLPVAPFATPQKCRAYHLLHSERLEQSDVHYAEKIKNWKKNFNFSAQGQCSHTIQGFHRPRIEPALDSGFHASCTLEVYLVLASLVIDNLLGVGITSGL